MNFRVLLIVAVASILAVLGFAKALQTRTEVDASKVQDWTEIPAPVDYSVSASRFLAEFVASGAFPITELKSNRVDSTDEDAQGKKSRPTFPTVVAIGILDGVQTAQIITRDGELKTVRRGDQLLDNWYVEALDMKKLVISNSEEEISIEF